MSTIKSRYWGFIMYPDSMPSDAIDILTQTGLPIAISPLHDKDFDPDGVMKKSHYHVLLCFDGPTTINVVTEISKSVNGSNVIRIQSVRGMYRYHCHLDNPEKYQYDESDRQCLNGFVLENYSNMTSSEQTQMCRLIMHYIQDESITEYFDLVNSLETWDLQAFAFAVNHTLIFKTYLQSRRNMMKKTKE